MELRAEGSVNTYRSQHQPTTWDLAKANGCKYTLHDAAALLTRDSYVAVRLYKWGYRQVRGGPKGESDCRD